MLQPVEGPQCTYLQHNVENSNTLYLDVMSCTQMNIQHHLPPKYTVFQLKTVVWGCSYSLIHSIGIKRFYSVSGYLYFAHITQP